MSANRTTLKSAGELLRRTPADYQWRFVPGPAPLSLYEDAVRWFSDRGRQFEGLAGFYGFGPIRAPGLSDIDVLYVLEDDFRDFARLKTVLDGAIPARFRPVVLHNPYFMRVRDLEALFDFVPNFVYEATWAREGLPRSGFNTDPLRLTLFLLDIVAESYPREYILFLVKPAIDEREILGRLKGLTYCTDLLARIGGPARPEYQAYGEKMQALRAGLFGLGTETRAQRVLALAQEAVGLSYQLARDTAETVERLWGITVEGEFGLCTPHVPALYTDALPEAPAYDVVRTRHTDVFALSPAFFGYLFAQYGRCRGPVSDRLRRCSLDRLRVSGEPAGEAAAFIRRRMELRNDHQAWLNRMRLRLPGYLTLGYRAPCGWRDLAPSLRWCLGHGVDRMQERKLRARLGGLLAGGG